MIDYISRYLDEVVAICGLIDKEQIAKFAHILKSIKGRCFILGLGGSAANASHLVNDLRKICNIEAYCPLDNVSELTARINDVSWEASLSDTLKVSKINEDDCVIILSVGGGSDTTSKNLVAAMTLAKEVGAKVLSIVSRDGGEARKLSDACVLIPVVDDNRVTPHAEEFQGIIWHLVVNLLKYN